VYNNSTRQEELEKLACHFAVSPFSNEDGMMTTKVILDLESLFYLPKVQIKFVYSYIKVIGSKSKLHEQKQHARGWFAFEEKAILLLLMLHINIVIITILNGVCELRVKCDSNVAAADSDATTASSTR